MGIKLRRFCDGTRFRYVFYEERATTASCQLPVFTDPAR